MTDLTFNLIQWSACKVFPLYSSRNSHFFLRASRVNYDRFMAQMGNEHWVRRMERFCGNELQCALKGVQVPCFVFMRWSYHDQFEFPYQTVVTLKPISPGFNPLEDQGKFNISLSGMTIIKE
jgi:hypothetical protein